ncbi:MAG: hypothetical protein AAFY76_25325, partial [Cyanobacteria bacterium J06649_11]
RIEELLDAMTTDTLSTSKRVIQLRNELADYYGEREFLNCQNMGEIVRLSMWMVLDKPNLYDDDFMSAG